MTSNFFNKRYSRFQHYIVAIAVLSICISVCLFLIHHEISQQENINNQIPKIMIPMPTAINPNFITQVNGCLIPTAAAYGYTLRITAGFRSIQEQNQLYDQGRTVNGHIITEAPAGRSIHNYGFAVDVVDRWRGYNINWTRLVRIAVYCGLESGGVGDLPHFEHRAGLTTADFAAGMRPPPLTLPCPIMAERMAANKKLTRKDLQSCGAPNF